MGIDFSQAQETRIIGRGTVTIEAPGSASGALTFDVLCKDCTANSLVLLSPASADAAYFFGSAAGASVTPAAGKFTIGVTDHATVAQSALFHYVIFEN